MAAGLGWRPASTGPEPNAPHFYHQPNRTACRLPNRTACQVNARLDQLAPAAPAAAAGADGAPAAAAAADGGDQMDTDAVVPAAAAAEEDASPFSKRFALFKSVLSGDVPIELERQFLARHNHADLQVCWCVWRVAGSVLGWGLSAAPAPGPPPPRRPAARGAGGWVFLLGWVGGDCQS